jgi:NADH:ubiquinone oxidoreductase subunit 2 (subunit N)
MTLLSFAVLIIVAQQTGDEISDFDGLAKRSPFLAFAMLVGMVSLAGVPFTAGFLGKFYIFYAAILQRETALVVVGVITVGCGFYYSKSRADVAVDDESCRYRDGPRLVISGLDCNNRLGHPGRF